MKPTTEARRPAPACNPRGDGDESLGHAYAHKHSLLCEQIQPLTAAGKPGLPQPRQITEVSAPRKHSRSPEQLTLL